LLSFLPYMAGKHGPKSGISSPIGFDFFSLLFLR